MTPYTLSSFRSLLACAAGLSLASLIACSSTQQPDSSTTPTAPASLPAKGPTPGNASASPATLPQPADPFAKPVKLFDGKTLGAWKPTEFGGQGEVAVRDGQLVLEFGDPMTGVTWSQKDGFPRINYEISLEAQRIDGSDFFCGLTFPVQDKPLTLIVGGWGGSLCGISSLDGLDAARNETAITHDFENQRWYRVRLQVTAQRVKAWIDDKNIIDVSIEGRKLGIRPEVELSTPLGLSAFQTTAALRNIEVRSIDPATVTMEDAPCPCTQKPDAPAKP
jgi:hypothetical protein